MAFNAKKSLIINLIILINLFTYINSLYYDGIQSYSIYPRLDLQLCPNSSLSFDFTVSTSSSSSFSNGYYSNYTYNSNKNKSPTTNTNHAELSSSSRMLIYSEQQIQISTGLSSKKLVNTYFLVKLVNGNRLVVNDYWSLNDITFQLPNDYLTSWFRFVYTRRSTIAEISLYKYEISPRTSVDQIVSLKLQPVFSKQIIHTNFLYEDILSVTGSSQKSSSFNDPTHMTYSQLLVGGVSDDNNLTYSYTQLKQLSKFHGYIMNLQYTSYSSLCTTNTNTNVDICAKLSNGAAAQRQYAIFSSSTSKQYKLQQFVVDRESLMIDDICESDTLTHDICPKDCSCLSNNFQAPYFNCDCSDSIKQTLSNNQCSMLYKSFALNLDDSNYFGSNQEKFDYPILPSFTKISVMNAGTQFDKLKGVLFKNSAASLNLMPNSEILEADACFWNIDDCVNGFVQHMIMSLDRIDEKKFNQKVILFINGQETTSKFVAYIFKNRLHFSIYEYDDNVEWIVSSGLLDKGKYLNRELKLTITWQRDKYFSLHLDGFLIDLINKPLSSPLNQDIYLTSNLNLNKYQYEYGTKIIAAQNSDMLLNLNNNNKLVVSHLEKVTTMTSHQFSIKYIKRDYFNDLDVMGGGQDSKIIVSSPLPSEIIRIDNTQRVMYKIDSPLTGVTTETIELSFRTSQPDGVIFYIRNNPIITYFELVRGQPVVVLDTRFKNVHLRPVTATLNDNQWHEVKLHRDGQTISVNIDSQYHDSADLGGTSNNQILTGGYVYLGLADPNNINLSDKKTFIGEMVRGKVTINNIQQKVVQQPYYWPSMPAITTNQTVNIDTSQITHDGKMINIIINVYGPPGFKAGINAAQQASTSSEQADTHYIYLDSLPDTRYVSVGQQDREIDFRTGGTRLDGFLIKFQTRQQCGQLVTLINDQRNYVGLEIFDGYVYATTSINGASQRFQISRVRVDDGRIYQINMKQEQQKLLCWLDVDDSYKQSIVYNTPQPIAVNTIRVAGQDGRQYGYASQYGFVGCIGAVMLNDRDVIDYKFVSSERRQSCQNVIQPPPALVVQSSTTSSTSSTPTTQPISAQQPAQQPSVSLGYISFSGSVDILVYNYYYDHEKPLFEDISFIFRTVVSHGVLFSAHNDDSNMPSLIGAYIKDGLVHVVYLNASFTQDLYFTHTTVDDGNLYRLNIRRNLNGHGFIQLQSYESVKALDFYTQSGKIKFTKVLVGGTDEWSRVKFFGTRPDFVGCIIDLFQINGNSVIKPVDINKDRYNCHVERRRPSSSNPTVVTTARPSGSRKPQCLPDGYPISFTSPDDAITYQHETQICEHIQIPFRTRDPRGIIYSHSSDDGRFYIIVYLRRGFLNIIVRDNNAERELELESKRVDDGDLHKLDIHCYSNYLIAYIDQNRQVMAQTNRVELSSPIYLSAYTLGYFNEELLSSKYSTLDYFRGCLEQVFFNRECLINEMLADRNRLTCSVQAMPQQEISEVTTSSSSITKKTNCVNTCYSSDSSECVIELSSRGYLVYQGNNNGNGNGGAQSIGFTFKVTDLQDEIQELITILNSDQPIRLYLSGGQIMLDIRGQRISNIIQSLNYNDGKWHRLVLEKNGQELMVKIDEATSAILIPFQFSLTGESRIIFGTTVGKDTNNFHGLFKEVYIRYSNSEYDIVASTKDNRISGITCEGSVLVKSYEETPKLKCVSDPAVDSINECSTDGVCYASLWRNSSGIIEKSMRCFNREQLQPLENPLLCRSQDPSRYVIQCCNTQYCNRDLQLNLKEIDKNDERSIWRFRGLNSGKLEFNPYLTQVDRAELSFQFNTSKLEGNLLCTKDDNVVVKAELRDSGIFLTVTDLRSKRILKTTSCKPSSNTQFNDNKFHSVTIKKENRNQLVLTCDGGQAQTLQYDADIPFVNTKHGIDFGLDCANDKGKKFVGDLSQIVYNHDGSKFSFDDLQYSEDPRLTYDGYVEFRPKFITETYSDPKPIHFRSKSSSARIKKWDDSKIGRISFEFKQEITGENGFLFSTESGENYFAIIINDGYLESILSPHRVPNADSSNSIQFYDRFQRLFPYPRTRINDGLWHKLEFMMLGDSVGSFVLDDDFSTKIRFPMNYWSEDSAIVFGNNLDIQRDLKRKDLAGSFRGCIRNIVINNRLIDWTNKGSLVNIESGCYNYKLAPNQIFFLQLDQEDLESSSNIQLNGDGCVRVQSSSNRINDRETIEFLFKTNGDRMVVLDSMGSDFLIHTQGPGLTIRNKEDTFSVTLIERGIAFNDGNLHKFKLEKASDDNNNNKIEIELDNKYKKEYTLPKRTQLGPFYLGCSRDFKLKTRLMELKDFKGSFLNVAYDKLDLVDALNDGDLSTLVDGQVLWNTGASRTISSGNRQQNDDLTIMLNEANSFLKMDKIDFDSNSNISFSFKTNENDGLLAFISPADRQSNLLLTQFMAVELVDGAASLLVNFGQNKRLSCPLAENNAKLSDNKWHSIQIRREQRLGVDQTATITLGCDNTYVRMKLTELPKFPLTIVSMGNISGSSHLPNELWLSKSASKFIGCVRDFKLNKKQIDLYKETSQESRSTLSKGCKDNYILAQKSTSCGAGGGEFTLSFNGSQGISYALNDYVKSSSESVSLKFKTRVRNGLLFGLKKSENEPSFIVSLEDGRLKIVYDRELNDKVIYIGEPNLFNNNKWHTVNIRRYGPHVFGEVIDSDKTRFHVVDDLDASLFSNLIYRFIEIGQINSLSLTQEHPSFIGWLQNVKLNCDELLSYYLNLNDHLLQPNRPGIITGSAIVGDNSLLLHHQITFTGSCTINLPRSVSSSNEQRFNIHLFFKTGQSGVLFFRRGKDTRFMALELSDGVLRFVFELGGGLKVYESDRLTSLSDRKWHEVTLKRFDRQKFSMKIDDYKEILMDIGSNSPPLHELDASFMIGGLSPDEQHKLIKENLGNKGFIGCIASLEINNDAANLYSNMLQVCPSVQHGCIDSVCLPNPCANYGKCSLDSNQVSCDCSLTSYQGQFCRDDSLFHFFGGQTKKCGMIRYRIEQPVQDQVQDRLGFGFTTTNLESQLVRIESVDQKQFIDIKLKEGIIVLEMKLNNEIVDSKNYLPNTGERFNDNKYHVLQLIRNKNNIKFRIDNFEQLEYNLPSSNDNDNSDLMFHNQFYVYVGASQDARSGDLLNCYYGIMSGMILNGQHVILDRGTSVGDVIISGSKYVTTEIEGSRSISLLPDGLCPLGYLKTNNLCLFTGCPLYSDFLGDYTCRCYYSYYHISNGINECRKINDTSKSSIIGSSAKLIPAKTKLAEAPIGLILGIISGIALALLAAAIGARKCADGLCVPAPAKSKPATKTIGSAVSQVITGTATTTNDSYASSMTQKREEQQIPLIQKSSEHYAQSDEYYKDTLDFGYRDRYALIPPAPIFTQINETTEMFEQTSAGGGITTTTIIPTVTTTTYNTTGGGGSMSQSVHHSSHRNLAMDSLFYTQNNSSDYELSNVTCVTMTPNGKYAIIGQSNGTPQIWDTISGQLIRSMSGVCSNCSNLTLACNGTFLVGLANDTSQQQQQQVETQHTQSLQIWEVQTGKSIQMSHQIKCCVFSLSADSNSIFMAGNQRFGRGISVGILDLVTNELTKEIKSDPTISFGENPDSIVITPDERHAIVGCKSISGTNFVVFDITKSTEIAQTRSIALDADPKCIVVLNNNEVITGTRGGHLIQWNIHTCEPTISFDDPGYMQAHRSTINQISLSSDCEYLVSASSDFTAKVWNTKTKNLVCILSGHRGEVICASISNNDLVVTGSTDQTVGLWRLHNGNPISTMTVGMSVIEVNMAKHNKTIIAIGEKEGEHQRETQLLMLKVINVQR